MHPNPDDRSEATDLDHHDPVRAAFWTLQQIVPPFWWESPPNQATADVMQGIEALSKVIDRNCSVSPIDLRRVVADHLLHVTPEPGWSGLTLSCLPTGQHHCLAERACTCECESCAADDHWGCDRQEHDHSFDGAPPCQTEFDPDTCWTRYIDAPLEECLRGEFPRDGAPWPVTVDYLGDGEVDIRFAPSAEVDTSEKDQVTP